MMGMVFHVMLLLTIHGCGDVLIGICDEIGGEDRDETGGLCFCLCEEEMGYPRARCGKPLPALDVHLGDVLLRAGPYIIISHLMFMSHTYDIIFISPLLIDSFRFLLDYISNATTPTPTDNIALFSYHPSTFHTHLHPFPPFLTHIGIWDMWMLSEMILAQDVNVVDITNTGVIMLMNGQVHVIECDGFIA